MEHSELFDLAIGIGPDGRAVTREERENARRQLTSGGCLEADLQIFQTQREAEVIRDDTGRIRGCSFQDCQRPAVWERVFEQSLSASMIMTQTIAVATMAHGNVIKGMLRMSHLPADFEHQRLGQSTRDGLKMAHQYGCWHHVGGFTAIPSNSGRYSFVIVEATIPKQRPHAVFGISEEMWSTLQIAAEAQSFGLTGNPLSFCPNCRLPHDPISGKGIKSGEGDDFWRTFCAYCNAEIKPNVDA
jgi:hypothetical protein